MPKLTINMQGKSTDVTFTGTPVLSHVLAENGWMKPQPCGGRGQCGKCRVQLTGQASPPNAAEQRAGSRLACQAVLLGDCTVTLTERHADYAVELGQSGGMRVSSRTSEPSGTAIAAVDVGTTTVAVRVYDAADGHVLGEAGGVNPQTAVAADVLGRMTAWADGRGDFLTASIRSCIAELLAQATTLPVTRLVCTGNTTMLYLLTGRDPDCLAHAPFTADCLFDGPAEVATIPAYIPPCLSAFVGADTVCAVTASGMCDRAETSLLCDVGTNGEMALWHEGRLYVTSTAAGPCFEGAGIACGCGSVGGAIDRVWSEGTGIGVHVIGGGKAIGMCGSGLIDAVAVLGAQGRIDASGFMEEGQVTLTEAVWLTQQDIRAVQLAKAAISAGVATLLEHAGVAASQVEAVYLAGGFGSHLSIASACAIGLFPACWAGKLHALGNAALTGAGMLLNDPAAVDRARKIAENAHPLNLGGNPSFSRRYIAEMEFPFGDEDE